MKPKRNVSPNSVTCDIDNGDLFFLIAAAYFLESLRNFKTLWAQTDWAQESPDLALKLAKHPSPAKVTEHAAQLLCATHSKQEASFDYLAKITGFDKNKRNFESALKNRDPIAAENAFQERALLLLRFKEFRELNTPMLKRLLLRACETNDVEFLKQLGRRLSEKPKIITDVTSEIIRILLLGLWNDPLYGQPLCRLTDAALAKFFSLALRCRNLSSSGVSFDQVQKMRQRLKLKKGLKPYFKNVQSDGDRILIS